MTSMACIVMASGLMFATTLRTVARRPAIIHALTLSIILGSLYALLLDTGGGMVATLGRNPTLTGRTELWQQVIALSGNPLVGTGFESFWLGSRIEKLWSMYWWHPNESHNGYLEIYLTLGWIGVSLMAGIMVIGYRNAVVAFRRNSEFGRLMLAFFVASTVYNLTEAGFRGTDPIWFVFIWACMVIPALRETGNPSPQDLVLYPPPRDRGLISQTVCFGTAKISSREKRENLRK
jgi:O-antigen ligase